MRGFINSKIFLCLFLSLWFLNLELYAQEKYKYELIYHFEVEDQQNSVVLSNFLIYINKQWMELYAEDVSIKDIMTNGRHAEFYMSSPPNNLDISMYSYIKSEFSCSASYTYSIDYFNRFNGQPINFYDDFYLDLEEGSNGCNISFSEINFYYDLSVYPFFTLDVPTNPDNFFACKKNGCIILKLGNSQLYGGGIDLQVRLESGIWVSLSEKVVDEKNLYLSYSDLPSGYDWYNEVLQFRVVQPDGTFSEPISGYVFLEPSTFEIDEITPPSCHGSSDGVEIPITNLPASTVNTQLRYNIVRLTDSVSISGKYKNTEWYIEDALTSQIDIPIGVPAITLTSESFADNFKLTPGKYSIEVSFKDGTASSLCDSYRIFNIPDIAQLTLEPVFPEYSGSDGKTYNIPKNGDVITIEANVTGNQGNYSLFYKKDGGSPQSWAFNSTQFSAGKYVFFVSDENGCQSSEVEVILTQSEPINVLVYEYDPVCNPLNPSSNTADIFGSITFTVTGGIPGFSAKLFDTDNNEIWSSNESFANNIQQQINELSPGDYILKIWDQGSSVLPVYVSSNIVISEADAINLQITEGDVSCNGLDNGKIGINVIGGSNETFWFILNEGSPVSKKGGHTYENLSPNDYIVSCKNTFGCIAKSDIITMEEPVELRIVDASVVNRPNCSADDGSVKFSVTGGRINAFPYTVVVSRAGFSRTITLNEGAGLTSVTINNLLAGAYSVKVTNKDGCVSTTAEPITLTVTNPLEGITFLIEDASCAEIPDGSVTISNPELIQGGYTFASNPSAGLLSDDKINNLTSGNYKFTITETAGRKCQIARDMPVGVILNQIQLLTPETTPAYCSTAENGKVLLSATGSKGSEYLFSTDGENYQMSGFFTGIAPGNYVAYVKDEVGCSSSVDYNVASDPEPFTASIQHNETRCAASSEGWISVNDINYNSMHSHELFYIDITDSEGTRNEYSNGAIPANHTINGLKSDSYIVELRDAHNCKLTIPVTVSNKGLEPRIAEPDFLELVACEGKTNAKANVVINHAMSYSGIFSVELFEKGNSGPIQTQSVVGSGKTVSFNNLGHESYIIKATDDQQCSVSLEFIPDYISNPLSLQDNWGNAPCLAGNGMVTVSATGGLVDSGHDYMFSLNGIPITYGAKAFSPGTSGKVQVTDKYGCSLSGENKSITVRPDPLMINAVAATNPLCAGESNGSITPQMQWLPDKYTYSYQLYRKDLGAQVYKTGFLSMQENKITGLPSGIYDLFVYEMDGGEKNNCSSDYPDIELKEPDPFSIKINYNYIKSKGNNSGVCNIAIQGGSGRYNYQLLKHPDNVIINEGVSEDKNLTLDKLYAGTYTLKISDMSGCLSSAGNEWVDQIFEIKEPAITLGYTNYSISNVSCNGLTNGSIELSGQIL